MTLEQKRCTQQNHVNRIKMVKSIAMSHFYYIFNLKMSNCILHVFIIISCHRYLVGNCMSLYDPVTDLNVEKVDETMHVSNESSEQ